MIGKDENWDEDKAIRAFLKLPNVQKAYGLDLNTAIRRYATSLENTVILQGEERADIFGKLKYLPLKKELGRIAFAKKIAVNGGQEEGLINPGAELIAEIIRTELAQLVVAYAA